jgi:hypothetical protein
MPPLRLRAPLQIHLDAMELDLTHRIVQGEGGDDDIIVEAIVTNRAPTPATLELTAFAAGYPRGRASISDLASGASVMRRFSFPRAGTQLKGGMIAVTVHNAETGARINRSIILD